MLAQLEQRSPGDSVALTMWSAGQTREQAMVLAAGERVQSGKLGPPLPSCAS